MRYRALFLGVAACSAIAVTAGATVAAPAHRHAAFGTVVDWRAASQTATIARPGGTLLAVHSHRRIAVGTTVNVRHLRRLHNGTFSATIVRVGHTRHARIRGVVVARRSSRGFAVGAIGTTFFVRTGHRHVGTGVRNDGLAPGPGATVVTDVDISGGDLTEIDVRDVAPGGIGRVVELEGRILQVDSVGRTVTLANRDDGVTMDFVVSVPEGVDITGFAQGAEVELSATVNADGTFTLSQESENGDAQQADGGGGSSHDGAQGSGGGPRR